MVKGLQEMLSKAGINNDDIRWDVLAMSTFFVGCAFYLYLSMIPDLALLPGRQSLRLGAGSYIVSLRLDGPVLPRQRLLEKSISQMTIPMIMLAVSGYCCPVRLAPLSSHLGGMVHHFWRSGYFLAHVYAVHQVVSDGFHLGDASR